ncbi:putative T7SS-secreted protein [Streptomyces sp. CG4]|uniref:putative T7SS-secreted protein n=1 Tax=Streptomyces sp. CG4 TaxID=408783 RepID=UPI0034E1CBA9
MARPTDWSPLAEEDPVPGDVHDIRDESTRLGKLAKMISEQVDRLNSISRDTSELKGEYAGALRDKADELSGRLAKTHHRYDHVSGYLGHWADDLEYCQKQADDALQDAKDAQRRIDAHQPPHQTPGRKPDPDHKLTEAERSAETARKKALEGAQGDLSAARTKLNKATGHRNERAGHWAGKIRRAISKDGLHDKGWDKFKNFMAKHARFFNDLANALSWVATALAVISLFIPGVNIIGWIAFGFMAGTLLTHTALALAGQGNWVDVGLDVVGLLTFGAGKVASKGLETAAAGLRGALRGGAGKLGQAAYRSAAKSTERALAGRLVRTATKGSQDYLKGQQLMSKTSKAMWAAKKSAISDAKALAGKEFEPGFLDSLKAGGPDAAAYKSFFGEAASRFPDSPDIAARLAKGGGALRVSQAAFAAGTGADTFDKVVGMTEPYVSGRFGGSGTNSWTDLKNGATVETGSTW